MHLTSLFRTRRTTETDEVIPERELIISGRAAHTPGSAERARAAPRALTKTRLHFLEFPPNFRFPKPVNAPVTNAPVWGSNADYRTLANRASRAPAAEPCTFFD